MIRCRVPVVAAVNGPAVGLGCSVIALSDVVYMAESAYLSDPHVTVGLVAADGGPLTWPLHTSLLLAKEYAFTGDRISATRAAEIGLANHVCPDGEVLAAALAAAHKIAALAAPGRRGDQARAEPARRAGGARHHRLRDGVRDASRSTRPTCARTSTASSDGSRRRSRARGGPSAAESVETELPRLLGGESRASGSRRGGCRTSCTARSAGRARRRAACRRRGWRPRRRPPSTSSQQQVRERREGGAHAVGMVDREAHRELGDRAPVVRSAFARRLDRIAPLVETDRRTTRSRVSGSDSRVDRGADVVARLADGLLEQREHQLVLAVEVLVEAAERLLRPVDDLLDRELGRSPSRRSARTRRRGSAAPAVRPATGRRSRCARRRARARPARSCR